MKKQTAKVTLRKVACEVARPNFSSHLVHLSNGEPVTDSLVIAREFQRRHDNVIQSIKNLIGDGTINRLDFKVVKYCDAKGEDRKKIELTERGALTAMPFIGGRKSRQGQKILVASFLALREKNAANDQWIEPRRSAAVAYVLMSEKLYEARQCKGKATVAYHYCNEAKMINGILFGIYGAVDRQTLSSEQLTWLVRLEMENAILIKMGKDYSERKALLTLYAAALTSCYRKKLRGQS
ncbi:Rha family transcriptional regulator [Undibacterium cyanobacteriorum]|uniref:Rha family transcriptional regulator n=1 Tax=Undibacterium cyanobacteriorum TaxID=3073561 RepID=A0ABY9RCN6_9BURK|nr:Rha family transcriptional regulator [Undibacterium sp. 20NA77.5]WMW78992.1 Rha family transcriptional regulator [Undibacterium sp. 20NA77.5]